MSSIHEDAPNPQFVRPGWLDLTGTWRFRFDDNNQGINDRWFQADFGDDSLQITVPYPPESKLSGIADPSFHPVVWYQRTLPEIPTDAPVRTLIRFGAVDFEATVWIDGVHVGGHRGGSSPFSIEVSTEWLRSLESPQMTLRVFDDPVDKEQPRGKQAWTDEPDGIWYKRTTGIWQPVWMEFVPEVHLEHIRWVFDAETASLQFDIELSRKPFELLQMQLEINAPDGKQTRASIEFEDRLTSGTIGLQDLGDTDTLLWSPESPTLLSTRISTSTGDSVNGYIGLRSLGLKKSGFEINGVPTWLRLVLSQGYFPESHYAAPSAEAIRREVEITLALGFNGARTHQKAEDPRYLYWADRLGLLIWGEIGAAYTWSDRAIADLSNEWRELVRRDINHPSIITWVPFNESWGVSDLGSSELQRNAVRTLYALTNALDGTRPVIGNDGWEHVSTDVLSLHDYNWDGAELRTRYSSGKSNEEVAAVYTVANKIAVASVEKSLNELPAMITEYGGVSFAPSGDEEWYGYGKVSNQQEFVDKYRELTAALHASADLVGICYTQLTDTEQETNGLLTEDRVPKLDAHVLSEITRGNKG